MLLTVVYTGERISKGKQASGKGQVGSLARG
jgi:hypothetical protein